jgi:hypothetical protein
MFNKLVFDTTDAETIEDSHHVGSHTLSGVGALITSGDIDSDDLSTTAIEGLDVRAFGHIYDLAGDNWDRLQGVNGAVKVYIDDGDFEVDVVIEAEKVEDTAHTTGDIGNYVLGVRIDDLTVDNSALLAGTNGDYQGFFTNNKGEMYVKDTDALTKLTEIDTVLDGIKVDTTKIASSIYDEDTAHTTGDKGQFGLSIRIDDIDDDNSALLAGTNGDYQGTFTDAKGSMYVTLSEDVIVNDAALANTAITHSQKAAAADDVAEAVVAGALANRKYLYLANSGNKVKAIGGAGVTIATGFPIHPGSYLNLRAGAAVAVQFAARKTIGSDLRVLELS